VTRWGRYSSVRPWAIEATLGYKFDKVNGSNGTIEFTRIPLDVVASWAPGNHRLGAGATFHLAPRFKCDAAGVCGDSISFNTAAGAIIQYAYVLRPGSSVGFEFGLRGTLIRYASSDVPTQNGSGVGFFFGGGWI
jgi:hypothetical protein